MENCKYCSGLVTILDRNLAKCTYCGHLFAVRGDKLEEPDLETTYRDALADMALGDEDHLLYASELFEVLGSYKDSAIRANRCRELIKEKQKAADAEALKRKRVTGLAFLAAIVFGAALTAFLVSNHQKSTKYEEALALAAQNRYEEALEIFEEIPKFSDVADQVALIQTQIKERNDAYERGVGYYSSEQYELAIRELAKCLYYRDAEDYYNGASEAIYRRSEVAYETERYAEAKELLSQIPEDAGVHNDALVLLAEVETALEEQRRAENYEAARKYFDEGSYGQAQALFVELRDYLDTQIYLSQIGEQYYGRATEAYEAGDYPGCADFLLKIDSKEEWAQYARAKELWNQAKEAYKERIRVEGKAICRSKGVDEMEAYVDSRACSLMTQEDLDAMKDACTIRVISLADLTPYSHDDGALDANTFLSDSVGNRYDYALSGYYGNSANSFMHEGLYIQSNWYYLEGKYAYLTGTVAVPGGGEATGYIEILGDGKILYADQNITKYTLPYEISVDITGVETLVIRMGNYAVYEYLTVMLGNPMVSE